MMSSHARISLLTTFRPPHFSEPFRKGISVSFFILYIRFLNLSPLKWCKYHSHIGVIYTRKCLACIFNASLWQFSVAFAPLRRCNLLISFVLYLISYFLIILPGPDRLSARTEAWINDDDVEGLKIHDWGSSIKILKAVCCKSLPRISWALYQA